MNKLNYPKSNEILFLRGDINYTEFHLVDGKMIVSSFTLKKHEEYLVGFLRVSKKHLVNPDFVRKVEHNQGKKHIEMQNGTVISIARRRQSIF